MMPSTMCTRSFLSLIALVAPHPLDSAPCAALLPRNRRRHLHGQAWRLVVIMCCFLMGLERPSALEALVLADEEDRVARRAARAAGLNPLAARGRYTVGP